MRVNWKECPRGDVVGQWAEFYVTMNTRGHIVFSRKTYERLGEPKAFILMFDEVNNRIGLKPLRRELETLIRRPNTGSTAASSSGPGG